MERVRIRRLARVIAASSVLGAAIPAGADAAEPLCERERCATVRGTVRRAGDRVAIDEAHLILAGSGDPPSWTRTADTQADGAFEVTVPGGPMRVIVLHPGFRRFDETFQSGDRMKDLVVVLRPDASDPYRTVVVAKKREDVGVSPRRLDREEMATLPGSQGDALRGLQSLPGVARTPGGLGLLVLRGASPDQSALFIGEHRVPRAFHALAISSVVPADALDEVEYVPGNFSSRYGNGSGGAVLLHPRKGRRDGVHGYGEVDLAGVGALIEGPVGRGSMLAAAQRSYFDAYLLAVEALYPESFVLPAAWDYQLFVDHPIGRRSTVAVRFLGSEDRVRSRFRSGGEIMTGSELNVGFHRTDLELRHASGRWRFLLTPSFRFEYERIESPGVGLSRRRDYITSARAEAEVRLSRRASLTLGADTELDPYQAEAPAFLSNGPDRVRGSGLQTSTGLYTEARLRLGAWTLTPGLRFNAFTNDADAKLSADPRLVTRLDAGERWTWRAGVGLHSEPEVSVDEQPTFFLDETVGGFSQAARWQFPSAVRDLTPTIALLPESDQVRLAQALQASTAVTYAPGKAWAIEVGGFLRHRDESLRITRSFDDEPVVEFPPRTRNYGVEVFVRRLNVRRLYGWVSYTLSWARRDLLEAPHLTAVDPFDQRHNLAVVGSYALPRHWRIGGRFRIVSGSPYTPIVGYVDAPATRFIGTTATPLYGEPNSARFPTFHQLDLRVDKRWYSRRVITTAYLDVQNVYNRPNVELYHYSPDFRRREGSFGLPIFPSFGLRIDW